jgi:hypothetical protein
MRKGIAVSVVLLLVAVAAPAQASTRATNAIGSPTTFPAELRTHVLRPRAVGGAPTHAPDPGDVKASGGPAVCPNQLCAVLGLIVLAAQVVEVAQEYGDDAARAGKAYYDAQQAKAADENRGSFWEQAGRQMADYFGWGYTDSEASTSDMAFD